MDTTVAPAAPSTGKDAELLERYRNSLPSFVKPMFAEPISIDHGEGSSVFTADGDRYLDMFGGVLTTMIGHAHPKVVAAVQAQAAKVMHSSTLYLNEPMIALAEKICALSGIPDARVFFTTSGTEANDTALLLATSYRQSNQVLAMRNSYHGRSFTAQAITSHSSWSSTSISGLDVHFVQGAYKLRSPFTNMNDADFTTACVDDLSQMLDMMSAGQVACLIAEPIQGVGGFATPPDGFFGAFKKELDAHGILLISDEVQTGWGRTGEHYWGYQAHDMVPDMLTFAKGVGNGASLAGVVARAEIMDTITVTSFSTFGGNPLSAAAGLATLQAVEDEGMQANALVRGQQLTEALQPAVDATDWIAELRGKGLMQAMEFVHPGTNEPDAARAGAFLEACRAHGLLVGKGGLYGNVIRIAPMLNVSEAEMAEGIDAMLAAIADLADA
ncbi:MAG: aminotransferase class III-fold pyridoxal phosphate-dependent enzyme [Actinomycetota bacterium]